VTNLAYRSLCSTTFGAPLCVSEMVTAGTLLSNSREALRIASFAEHEPVRSVQLYGVRPEQVCAQCPATANNRTPAFPEDEHARLGVTVAVRRARALRHHNPPPDIYTHSFTAILPPHKSHTWSERVLIVFRRRTSAARSSQLVRCAHTEAR
jgi:hypothetical protein